MASFLQAVGAEPSLFHTTIADLGEFGEIGDHCSRR